MIKKLSSQSKRTPPIFKSDLEPWFNACLNFTHDQLSLYIIGYRDAAEVLNRHVLENRGKGSDTLVYPIIFLYRHYIELQLKSLIKYGSILSESPEDIPLTHDIKKLWEKCRRILEEIWPDDSESLNEVEECVLQISEVDPSSQAFRYSKDKGGKNTLPGIKHINLKNFHEKISRVASILEGADAGISHYLDNVEWCY